MRKLLLLILLLPFLLVGQVEALTRVSTSRPSTYRSSTYHPSETHVSTRNTPKPWSTSTHYAAGNGRKVGTGTLKSNTTAPLSHIYSGKTYNSSTSVYTDTHGFWVYYWIFVNNQFHCYDDKHKEVICTRDKDSWQKDW